MAQRRLQILPYTVARWAIIGKTSVRWPKQREMLAQPLHSEPAIAEIVHQVQQSGAGEGWSALWGKIHVPGLGPAFGTKLLYFAGVPDVATWPRSQPGSAVSLRIPATTFQTQTQTERGYPAPGSAASWASGDVPGEG